MFTSARSASRSLFLGALVATALVTTGCKDDPGPGKLFEEEGTWELVQFGLGGTGLEEVQNNRAKNFLLSFDEENMVVQTAMCSNDETDTPANSECAGFNDSRWICQCFAYDFVEEEMAWLEFNAGETPPIVKVGESPSNSGDAGGEGGDTDTDGGSGGGESGGGESGGEEGGGDEAGGGDEGGPMAGHQFVLTELAGTSATFDFTPLPAGVFGSDGVASKFIFQKKAASVFDVVLEDPDRPSCQPCI